MLLDAKKTPSHFIWETPGVTVSATSGGFPGNAGGVGGGFRSPAHGRRRADTGKGKKPKEEREDGGKKKKWKGGKK